jgi:hypothetical protein
VASGCSSPPDFASDSTLSSGTYSLPAYDFPAQCNFYANAFFNLKQGPGGPSVLASLSKIYKVEASVGSQSGDRFDETRGNVNWLEQFQGT